MRPVHLVLDSFGSFRGRHELALDGVDLFVLEGPTGAGKSTLIDAMTMALYGAVPRYDDARLVEPAINKLATQAKVSLTFDAEGARHVVTRVLSRTKGGGGTTKEARLERLVPGADTEVLAGSAKEVTGEVTRLLGLTFEEFCRTVVLPQGAFAEFLHGARRDRNEMLVRLLDLGVYAEVGTMARDLGRRHAQRIEAIDEAIAPLVEADEQAVADARARAEQLRALERTLTGEALPDIERQAEAGAALGQALDTATARAEALQRVSRPDGVQAVAEALRRARTAVTEAAEAAERAEAACDTARRQRADAPDPAPLRALLEVDASLAERRAEVEQTAEAVTVAAAASAEAERGAAEATAAAADADAAVRAIEREHLAHTLAQGLSAGDDCPVCSTTLDAPPAHAAPADLDAAVARREQAAAEARRAQQSAAAANGAVQRAEAQHESAARRLAEDTERRDEAARATEVPVVDGTLDRGEAQRRITAAAEAERAVGEAEATLKRVRTALADARADHERLERRAAEAWQSFDAVRDRVAAYGAPAPARDDLSAAWEQLEDWARGQRDDADRAVHAARAAIEEARARYRAMVQVVREQVRDAGVEVPDQALAPQALAACASAAAEAEQRTGRLADDLDRATRLRVERASHVERQQVAELLASVLRRDAFEQWLLNRLSRRLVAGASRILAELTSDAFALDLSDAGGFEVIDHLNADERRSAKTLSGGETFLASLALALALAEHVTHVGGRASLDALFLDEGFGTLDPATLDVVATAIEELAGRRLVGVITHVPELAARLPHRVHVYRDPDGSHIAPRIETPA